MFKLRLAIRWPRYIFFAVVISLLAFIVNALLGKAFGPTGWSFLAVVLATLLTSVLHRKFHERMRPERLLTPTVGCAVATWLLPKLPNIIRVVSLGHGTKIDTDNEGWNPQDADIATVTSILAAVLAAPLAEAALYGLPSCGCGNYLVTAEAMDRFLCQRHGRKKGDFLDEALVIARTLIRSKKKEIEALSSMLTSKGALAPEDLTFILGPRPAN